MKKDEYLSVCQKCNALCCKLGGTNLTKKEVDRVLAKGFKNHFVQITPEVYELKSKPDGVCPYLKEDLSCEIHEVKPIICTSWPVFPEFDNGKIDHILINCPLTRTLSKEEIEECKKESSMVNLKVSKITCDYASVPESQRKMIKEIYKIIETEKFD